LCHFIIYSKLQHVFVFNEQNASDFNATAIFNESVTVFHSERVNFTDG